MKQKLFAICLVLLLTFGLVGGVSAQSYSFSLDSEVVNVYWNSDGTMSLDYVFTFTNQPGAHVIDFVDVGLPNDNYNTINADVNGVPVGVSTDYQGTGTGVAVDLGSQAIQPGQAGIVHVFVGGFTGVIYPDDNDEAYASAVFAPTFFGSEFVVGETDLTVTFHLPPGVKPEEPRWHGAPSGFPSEPQTGIDNEGRVTYTWRNPNASGSSQYEFGASFPKIYIPPSAIVTPPAFDFSGLIDSIINGLGSILCIGFFVFMFAGLPILTAIGNQRRKLQYMSPKIAIEGHGIKRGLTAVEAAILMEQPLDKVMTMILFGAVKKGAAVVAKRDPLSIDVKEPLPEGLHEYEIKFLQAFKETGTKERRGVLQNMTVALIKSVSEKMKGFSRKESIEYYKRIMESAWEQVQKAETPEVQMAFFDQQLEWTMLDKDYDDRSRRVFNRPVYLPMWWGNYDPTYTSRPLSTSSPAAPPMPSQTSGRTSLPGADFAASMVTGVQTFSQKVIGNVQDFTGRVTNVTNPPPKPTSGGRSGGGRSGGGCACACACAGCACACAGGGR